MLASDAVSLVGDMAGFAGLVGGDIGHKGGDIDHTGGDIGHAGLTLDPMLCTEDGERERLMPDAPELTDPLARLSEMLRLLVSSVKSYVSHARSWSFSEKSVRGTANLSTSAHLSYVSSAPCRVTTLGCLVVASSSHCRVSRTSSACLFLPPFWRLSSSSASRY